MLETYNIDKNVIDLSLKSGLIQLLGLQALLAPRFIIPNFTLWFVGAILIFYLIYPLIVYPWRDGADGTHLILASFAVLLPFVVMRLAFNIIDFRFFMYYWIFVAGILASKYGAMYRFSPQPRFLCAVSVVLIALLSLMRYAHLQQAPYAAAEGYLFNLYVLFPYTPSDLPLLISLIILLNTVALLFIYVAFIAARLYAPLASRALLSLLLLIAYASYSIYLFNRQVFACVDVLVHAFPLGMVQADVALMLLAFPLLLGIAYFVQRQENNIVIRIRNIQKKWKTKTRKSADF